MPDAESNAGSLAANVEALAKITCADDHENCGYAAWDDAPEGIREYHRGHARAILASDWLTGRAAKVVAMEYEGYLDSDRLDSAWIAGWHAAINHATAALTTCVTSPAEGRNS